VESVYVHPRNLDLGVTAPMFEEAVEEIRAALAA